MESVETITEPEPPLECSVKPPLGPEDSCDFNPDFAVICSFIQQFGSKIDLELDIETLKSGLENQDTLDDDLIELHVKLLKKLRRYFVRDQWEKALMRYAFEYSYEHGREIEFQGYLKTRPSLKLELLRRLLDAQFECDQKFKVAVNTDEAAELRNQPLGRDIKGNIYWHCQDKEGHLRIYNEHPVDHKSWRLLCKDADELDKLIEDLDEAKDDKIKGDPQKSPYNPYPDIFPEYFTENSEQVNENEDETKNSSRKPIKNGRRGRPLKKSGPSTLAHPSVNGNKPNETKPLIDIEAKEHLATAKPTVEEVSTSVAEESSQANSIESQVKQTLDSIIQRVSNSIDFFFRWNSSNTGTKDPEPAAKPRKRAAKREKIIHEELPRRTSSRIQQLQQKKITEYVEKKPEPRILEPNLKVSNIAKDNVKSIKDHSRLKKPSRKAGQRWKSHKKKKLSWDKDDSDLSSTSSLTDSNDESFVEELNGALDPEAVHESDEFACEEEETNDAPVIIKRARTARQMIPLQENGDIIQDQSMAEEDKPCGRCDKADDPEWILLCDMCDDGYHTMCCNPPLMFVPDGDWFCPPCEHKTLLIKLREISAAVKNILEEKERERQKRQRLRHAFKKVPVIRATDEVLSEKRRQTDLPDLNPPNAVQELDEILGEFPNQELPNSYRERAHKRPKKKPRPRNRRRERELSDDEYEIDFARSSSKRKRYELVSSDSESQLSGSSSDESQPRARKARACVSYRFQEFDELIQSAIQADSDDQMPADDDEEAEEAEEETTGHHGRGKDMATIEALAYQQENGFKNQDLATAPAPEPPSEPKVRKKGRRLNDLDAESEIDLATSDDSFQAFSETDVEDEEEEEEEEITEVDSEDESSIDEIIQVSHSKSRAWRKKKDRNRYETDESDESDESDFEPRTRRRASKKVSYKESTDEEEEVNSDHSKHSEPENPPFYREDEVRSPSSDNRQKSWL